MCQDPALEAALSTDPTPEKDTGGQGRAEGVWPWRGAAFVLKGSSGCSGSPGETHESRGSRMERQQGLGWCTWALCVGGREPLKAPHSGRGRSRPARPQLSQHWGSLLIQAAPPAPSGAPICHTPRPSSHTQSTPPGTLLPSWWFSSGLSPQARCPPTSAPRPLEWHPTPHDLASWPTCLQGACGVGTCRRLGCAHT